MRWNTRPFTNIDNEIFAGRYNGVDFKVMPNETRFLPSEVSEHLAKQLLKICADKELKKQNVYPAGSLLNIILGKEILTKDHQQKLTFAEEVAEHERQFEVYQKEKKKENLMRKDEALEIADESAEETPPDPAEKDV